VAASAIPHSSIAATAVTPGSYTIANITVAADGSITAAANGSAGGAVLLAPTTDQAIVQPGSTQFSVTSGTGGINFSTGGAIDFNSSATMGVGINFNTTADMGLASAFFNLDATNGINLNDSSTSGINANTAGGIDFTAAMNAQMNAGGYLYFGVVGNIYTASSAGHIISSSPDITVPGSGSTALCINPSGFVGTFGCGGGSSGLSGMTATQIPIAATATTVTSSVPAPVGTIVGTTDTQTLTNKTLDGVTPTTMGFFDPTSSVQTQLNGKQAALTNPVVGPGSGATVGHLAVMGNTAGTSITDGGAVPTLSSLGGVPTTTTVNGHALSSNVIVSASDLTTGTLPHAQLPTLLSADIPNNAANTTGTAANITATSNSTITTLPSLSLPYSQVSGTPSIPTVGTWGALNYPTWVSGTPFVKMTAAGTFALDTNTYLTSSGVSGMTTGQLPVAASATTVTSSIAYATANTASTVVERDGSGNVGVTNVNLSSGINFGTYSVGTNPDGVAVDQSGNVWVANYGSANVTKLSSAGATLGTYSVGTIPIGVAVDQSGNVWVANQGSNNVTKLSSGSNGVLVPLVQNLPQASGPAITPTSVSINGGANTVYLCSGGTFAGLLATSSAACTGGTGTATSLKID
jgi:hypothetical protein